MMFPASAFAEAGQKPPPVREMPGGCTVEALDLFKETRAKFSLEVGTGALPESILDLGGCDHSGADLSGKVLSGAIASGANFERANLTGGEMSRAKAIGTNFATRSSPRAQLLRGELRRRGPPRRRLRQRHPHQRAIRQGRKR